MNDFFDILIYVVLWAVSFVLTVIIAEYRGFMMDKNDDSVDKEFRRVVLGLVSLFWPLTLPFVITIAALYPVMNLGVLARERKAAKAVARRQAEREAIESAINDIRNLQDEFTDPATLNALKDSKKRLQEQLIQNVGGFR